jgi:hypothetical protein
MVSRAEAMRTAVWEEQEEGGAVNGTGDADSVWGVGQGGGT